VQRELAGSGPLCVAAPTGARHPSHWRGLCNHQHGGRAA
jgi:hypothetical protein